MVSCAISFKYDDLRRGKAFREMRGLPLRVISAETGLSQVTMLGVNDANLERVYLRSLQTLRNYFQVKSLCDLTEYVPDCHREDSLWTQSAT